MGTINALPYYLKYLGRGHEIQERFDFTCDGCGLEVIIWGEDEAYARDVLVGDGGWYINDLAGFYCVKCSGQPMSPGANLIDFKVAQSELNPVQEKPYTGKQDVSLCKEEA
jgi:hypothetical protein